MNFVLISLKTLDFLLFSVWILAKYPLFGGKGLPNVSWLWAHIPCVRLPDVGLVLWIQTWNWCTLASFEPVLELTIRPVYLNTCQTEGLVTPAFTRLRFHSEPIHCYGIATIGRFAHGEQSKSAAIFSHLVQIWWTLSYKFTLLTDSKLSWQCWLVRERKFGKSKMEESIVAY